MNLINIMVKEARHKTTSHIIYFKWSLKSGKTDADCGFPEGVVMVVTGTGPTGGFWGPGKGLLLDLGN